MKVHVWLSLVLWLGLSPAASALCGSVSIGYMSWNASKIMADIQGRILEAGFECRVDKVEMIEQPVLGSVLERGQPDVVAGVWLHEITDKVRQAVIDGKLVPLGDLFAGGSREGWWVPKYFVASYGEIVTVEEIKQNYEFFVEAGSEKAVFHNCPESWACRIINDNLFAAYGLGELFDNVYAESGEALVASLERAARLELPWFGYYWAPNAIMAKVPLHMVGMNDLDAKGFRCNARVDCEHPHAGSFPLWRVLTVARRQFVESHPAEVDMLRRSSVPEEEMNRLLLMYEDTMETPETVVDSFLATQMDLWKTWVSEDVAALVVESGIN